MLLFNQLITGFVFANLLLLFGPQIVELAPTTRQDENPWLQRKAEFYQETSFDLSEENIKLLGGKFAKTRKGHLPFWFNYELFKAVYNKKVASNPREEWERHHMFVKSCVRTLKARVLFRILAGTHDSFITEEADLVSLVCLE